MGMKTYVFRGEIRRSCTVTVTAETFAEAWAAVERGDFFDLEESNVEDTEFFDDGEEASLQRALDSGYGEAEVREEASGG